MTLCVRDKPPPPTAAASLPGEPATGPPPLAPSPRLHNHGPSARGFLTRFHAATDMGFTFRGDRLSGMPVDCYVARASLLGRRPRGRDGSTALVEHEAARLPDRAVSFLPARRRRYAHDCSGRIIGLEEALRWLATSEPFATHCSPSRRRGDSHRDRDTPDAPPRCRPPSGSAPTLCWVTPIGFAAPEYWGAEWRPIFRQRDPLNFWQRRE